MPRLYWPLAAILLSACANSPSTNTPSAEGSAKGALQAQLISMERDSWTAWQKRDGAFYSTFLSADHFEVGASGTSDKAEVVGFVGSPVCVVDSYALRDFHFTQIDAGTALLVYHAEQQTRCGSAAVPSPVWVSSLFVHRDGRWQNVLYQQSKAAE